MIVPIELEQHQARNHLGISINEYEQMPGTRKWIEEDNPALSKSDVIAIYRLSKLVDSIYQDMSMPNVKR